MSKYRFFRRHPGEGTPMILAIVLVLLILFCTVAEFSRVWIIAQGVKEAAQQAVISTINDNYDDVYHAVREGYAAGWYPDGTGRWDESVEPVRNDNGIGKADFSNRAKMRITLTFLRYFSAQSA